MGIWRVTGVLRIQLQFCCCCRCVVAVDVVVGAGVELLFRAACVLMLLLLLLAGSWWFSRVGWLMGLDSTLCTALCLLDHECRIKQFPPSSPRPRPSNSLAGSQHL